MVISGQTRYYPRLKRLHHLLNGSNCGLLCFDLKEKKLYAKKPDFNWGKFSSNRTLLGSIRRETQCLMVAFIPDEKCGGMMR